jgi:hypothetical protein
LRCSRRDHHVTEAPRAWNADLFELSQCASLPARHMAVATLWYGLMPLAVAVHAVSGDSLVLVREQLVALRDDVLAAEHPGQDGHSLRSIHRRARPPADMLLGVLDALTVRQRSALRRRGHLAIALALGDLRASLGGELEHCPPASLLAERSRAHWSSSVKRSPRQLPWPDKGGRTSKRNSRMFGLDPSPARWGTRSTSGCR